MVAYIKSAEAAPAPAQNATANPRRIPISIINMAMGPTGIAMPYPANMPRRNASIMEMLFHFPRHVRNREL